MSTNSLTYTNLFTHEYMQAARRARGMKRRFLEDEAERDELYEEEGA